MVEPLEGLRNTLDLAGEPTKVCYTLDLREGCFKFWTSDLREGCLKPRTLQKVILDPGEGSTVFTGNLTLPTGAQGEEGQRGERKLHGWMPQGLAAEAEYHERVRAIAADTTASKEPDFFLQTGGGGSAGGTALGAAESGRGQGFTRIICPA